MARPKEGVKQIRNIQRFNGSYYVNIPISFARQLGWRESQKVVVKSDRGRLVLTDWKK